MNHLFLNTLSKTINAYLHLDPQSKVRLQKLQGHVIHFEFLPFHFIFQCQFSEPGVTILSSISESPETTIRGTPIQLLGVAFSKAHRQQFFADDVTLEGNVELGQLVISLFDELTIDWEEYTSHFIGDIPAHHLHRYVNTFCGWIKDTKNNLVQNVNEYLHEEKMWFPTREALQDFFSEIDTLRLDVDRIEAKINQVGEESP